MLIRIIEYNYDEEDKLTGGQMLAATEVENYDIFLSMMQNMKGKDIKINKDRYTFEGDYLLNFPKDDNFIMCLDIFVCCY